MLQDTLMARVLSRLALLFPISYEHGKEHKFLKDVTLYILYHLKINYSPFSLYEDLPHYYDNYSHCQFLLVQYNCRLLMNIQISREITVNNQNQSLIVLQISRC